MPEGVTDDSDPGAVLKRRFGHDGFLPLQEDVVRNVLAGRDSLVLMPTGGGKSICYQLPAVMLDGVTLVVSPLIALMKDQVDALRSRGVRAAFINSTMTQAEVRDVQLDAYHGRLDILYVAPERLVLQQFNDFLHAVRLSLIAIDEAHCISEWGHDFRPDYRNLQALRDQFPNTPLIALTATATERVREDVIHQLKMPNAERFISSFNRPNLTYKVVPKRRGFERLAAMLGEIGGGSAIIYRFSRKDTEDLASRLSAEGFEALPYHAGLDDDVRRQTQERFISGDVPIIVATIAFGMGIDKPDIRLVVHYDLPKTIEGYYQETGRAGRDGQPSDCVLFFTFADKSKQEYFIDQIEDSTERANARERLARVVEYGSGNSCRREFLLAYFGERLDRENCRSCDVCLPREAPPGMGSTYDGTVTTQKVLSAIIRTGERFGAAHVVAVLRGSRARRVLELGHDKLSVYGVARGVSRDELMDVVDQLVERGLVARATGEFPTLSVTKAGREFLSNRETIELVRRSDDASGGEADREPDAELFGKLRRLRRDTADSLDVPAFFVFTDATLRHMAASQPRDRDSLLAVRGVGRRKAEQFGDRFLAAIAEHLEETVARPGAPSSGEEAVRPLPAAADTSTPFEKLLSRVFDQPVALTSANATARSAVHGHVWSVLSTFRDGEAHVLSRRFGLEDGREHTLQEIANGLGVSRERVRQIERKALRRLRSPNRLRELRKLLEADGGVGDAAESASPDGPCPDSGDGSYIDQVKQTHPRAYEVWTPGEEQALRGMFEEGRSIDDIAAQLGRQPSAITARLSRSGATLATSPTHAETLGLLREGLTVAEIALQRGITEGSVINHVEQLTDEGSAPDLAHLMPEPQRYERIRRAFLEADSDLLRPVKDLLGDDYSYEELRLVRLRMRQLSQERLGSTG